MAPKNKSAMRSIIKKRDKAYYTLEFNRSYPDVASEIIDQKNLKTQKQLELKSKKKLLPLEIASLPVSERNDVQFEREMEVFREKQSMSRRAIEQSYLRKLKKAGGEAEAAKYRETALKRLDEKEAEKVASLREKFPAGASAETSPDAAQKYEQEQKKDDAAMAALVAKHQTKKEQDMSKLKQKLDTQNKKLQEVFDSTNSTLRSMTRIDEESFGKENILSVKNLKMYFSGIKAVDDLSFDIKQGEIFGLIGPNGAGKTTAFNCITQFYKPTGGDVFYRDRFDNRVSLLDYNTPDVIKAGVSRTFQNLEMCYWLSVLDNLLVGAHAFYRATLADQLFHTPTLKREEEVFTQRALDLLERLDILQYKDMSPLGLPYGVLKKIELARTLMSNPRLIILDEPAAGLNDAETEDLAEIIRTIRDDFNCTIFLVEHDMNLVMNICDTVCAISFGKMLAIGTPDEIQDSPLVQEAYLGTE